MTHTVAAVALTQAQAQHLIDLVVRRLAHDAEENDGHCMEARYEHIEYEWFSERVDLLRNLMHAYHGTPWAEDNAEAAPDA